MLMSLLKFVFQRKPGHDWCLIKLGVRGQIRGFEVDTAFFTGNYSPKFSIQGFTGSDLESNLSPRDPSMGKEASEQELEEVKGHSLMTSPTFFYIRIDPPPLLGKQTLYNISFFSLSENTIPTSLP